MRLVIAPPFLMHLLGSESFMERTVDGLADADGVHTVQDMKSFRPADFDRLSCKPVVRASCCLFA